MWPSWTQLLANILYGKKTPQQPLTRDRCRQWHCWCNLYHTSLCELSGIVYFFTGLLIKKPTVQCLLVILFHEKKPNVLVPRIKKPNSINRSITTSAQPHTRDRCRQWHCWTPQHQRNLSHLLHGEKLEGCSWQLGIRQTFWKSPLPDS